MDYKVRHWDYIDALRGIAALGVVIVHTLILFPQLPWRASQLAGIGTHGVQLFFMVSAVTLASSWRSRANRESSPAIAFYLRRFFRIAPMFWVAGLFYLMVSVFVVPFWAHGGIEGRSIFLTAIFAHGWSPASINAVVPGGWSIADEMVFYLLFPVLISILTSLPRALAFFALAVVIALTANELALRLYDVHAAYFQQFTYYWLPNQLPIFALGFVAFHLIPWARAAGAKASVVLLAAGAAALLALAFSHLPFSATITHPQAWRDLLAGAGFLAIILSLAAAPWSLLVNPLTRLMGTVSFSSYLMQFIVIQTAIWTVGPSQVTGVMAIGLFAVTAVGIAAVNTTLAYFTYQHIEKPGIRLGNELTDRLELSSGTRSAPAEQGLG